MGDTWAQSDELRDFAKIINRQDNVHYFHLDSYPSSPLILSVIRVLEAVLEFIEGAALYLGDLVR